MRIESVTLIHFGPFEQRTMQLGPGLNVVFGPNEAGKSTWLAGAYLALCGLRRGRGQSRQERALEDRHRPWDGRPWQTAAVVELADGRRIELRQDLAAKSGSRAIDLAVGREVGGEIISDGAPDGSRWLGLDRSAFLATACVRQADVMAVTAHPELLREHLQRAAATGGFQATAAAALERIDDFHRRHVGGERAATRPLRQARDAAAEARARLAAAREEHDLRLRLAADTQRKEDELARAEAELAAAQAARARALAGAAAARLAHAERRDAQAPAHAAFDEEVAPAVVAAAQAWDRARHMLAVHRESAPPDPEPPGTTLDEESLRNLARELETPDAPVDPGLRLRLRAAERDAGVGGPIGRVPLVVSLALLLIGLGIAWLGHPVPAAATIGVAAALAVGAAAVRGRRRTRALTELRGLDRALAGTHVPAERRRQAGAQAAQAGLAPRPQELRALADAISAAREAAARRREWALVDAEHEALAYAATERLWDALAARGVNGRAGDVAGALEGYELACRQRREHLQAMLGGATLAELRTIAEHAAEQAAELERRADPALTAALRGAPDDDQVERLAQRVRELRRPVDEARGRLGALAGRVPSVAGADEELARAEAALERVERMDRVLRLTRNALERAQEDVHRSIAPHLAATLRTWLPRVTGGRYSDAAVDPEALDVQVCGPTRDWRPAALLSHGTREQVYLLLRIALVEQLTTRGEISPLFFDEITVHSDGARTLAVLELLGELSRTHQVLLFTHEQQVCEWARERMAAGRDRLLTLDAATAT